jgi:hypothetical protein
MSRLRYRSSTTVPMTTTPAESSCSAGVDDGTGQSAVPQHEASASAAAPSSREEFLRQATEDLRRAAYRYARRRAALVRRAGGRVDHLYAHELVQDALSDTWVGSQLTWAPSRCSLLEHVLDLIRSRSSKDLLAARLRPHVSLDRNPRAIEEIEQSSWRGASPSATEPQLGRLIAEVIAGLQRLTAGDTAAQAILAAWTAGLSDREDVMEFSGLTAGAYRKARARVTYLLQELPQSLRQAATAILSGPSSG